MDYKRQYHLLIEKARHRGKVEGYKERHHIIPRCMGGSNKKENLVELTAREHYVAHRLLYMWHRTPQMAYAWNAMAFQGKNHQRKLRAADYARAREAYALVKKGTKPWNTGLHHSEETRKLIGQRRLGKPLNPEHRKKIGEANARRVVSEETRRKMSLAAKSRRKPETTPP